MELTHDIIWEKIKAHPNFWALICLLSEGYCIKPEWTDERVKLFGHSIEWSLWEDGKGNRLWEILGDIAKLKVGERVVIELEEGANTLAPEG